MSELNYAELSEKDLAKIIEDRQKAVDQAEQFLCEAQSEANKRTQAARQKDLLEEKEKKFNSSIAKSLRERYKKAIEKLKDCEGEQTLTVNLPVTFSFNTDIGTLDKRSGYCYDLNVCSILDRGEMRAELGKVTGLTNRQRAVLKLGLENVVEQACDEIFDLFPDVVKKHNAAAGSLNKIFEDARNNGFTYEELRGWVL